MFALEEGLESVENDTRERYEAWRKKRAAAKAPGQNSGRAPSNHDTIALLVLGADGNIAGGCSTSGWAGKLPGRVGDSPIIGSGLYVDNAVGAAGATGLGENVMRFCGSFHSDHQKSMPEADDTTAPLPRERSGMHTFVLAMLFLVVVGGGSYAIRALYPSATLVVDADRASAAVLGASVVTLHQVDGPLFYTLREGRQTVRPGRCRIAVDWQETTLRFSTGTEFEAQRGKSLVIEVRGVAVEPATTAN